MNILAIDLGTQCGWALGKRGGAVTGGSVNFAPAKHGSHGQRWLAFRQFLTDTARGAEVHAVYFEDVKQHSGTLAAHAYGGFLAMLQAWCAANRIPMYPVGVGAIKKHWTGKGNASKEVMIESAKARGHRPVDDNHADALAILSFACAEEGKPEVLPF
jgi:Holliday junction resolvasome RuvABC endonuclease subunit